MKILLRIVFAVLGAVLMVMTFVINQKAQLSAFESSARSSETTVKEYIGISTTFINQMTVYANEQLDYGAIAGQPLFREVQYSPDTDTYCLDIIGGTPDQLNSGNITGLGQFPENGPVKNEISMALSLGKYFSSFLQRMPEVTWLYYTSEHNFIYIYPWVVSSKFSYTPDIKSRTYYTYATKANDLSNAVWTPVYEDAAGKGLVVSLSRPIYFDHRLTGVLSLDMTTEKLGDMIDSPYSSYIVDPLGAVIASNKPFNQVHTKFSDISGFSEEQADVMSVMSVDRVERIGRYYVYSSDIDTTPWRLYFTVPCLSVNGEAALYSSPILIACLLLFWSLLEVEKRRRTELALNDSLVQIKSYHNLLENSARLDFLTDTCNRRGFSDIFYERVALKDEKTQVALIMGDIDNFKNFNDQYGHTAGDRVLVEISGIMKKLVGENGVVSRWGGEEFLILALNSNIDGAARLAENIRREIEANEISWPDSSPLRATMTFGVAAYTGNDSMESGISKADEALYQGKLQGRNRVIVYSPAE